jgi:hypothetical protein
VELYATKSYELTDVMFWVRIESRTGFRLGSADALLAVDATARC